jgi:hypothetical protein
MMSTSRPKIPEGLRALAITRTGSGHLRWQHPDGKHVITPSTPHGGNRSIRNSRAELKRAGLTEERA